MKEVFVEVKKKMFQAIDGTNFNTSSECAVYEESALGVIMSKYKPLVMRTVKSAELFPINDESLIDLVVVTTEEQVDVVLQLFLHYNTYLSDDDIAKYRKSIYNTMNKDILLIEREEDNFWIIGSKGDTIKTIEKACALPAGTSFIQN